ncbi:MAG TPA: hypothetical protein PKH43_04135, partial [Saprospiraceae bacterium]|nr:hypothetical protein [Saprospiraceae bacterium]
YKAIFFGWVKGQVQGCQLVKNGQDWQIYASAGTCLPFSRLSFSTSTKAQNADEHEKASF